MAHKALDVLHFAPDVRPEVPAYFLCRTVLEVSFILHDRNVVAMASTHSWANSSLDAIVSIESKARTKHSISKKFCATATSSTPRLFSSNEPAAALARTSSNHDTSESSE